MTITTERLSFRPYQEDDFSFLFSLLTDPETIRFIGTGRTRNREEAREFLDWIYGTYEAGKNLGLMVLIRKEDGRKVGHAGWVPQMIDGEKEMEIGYWIARDYWGQGYATESAKALLAEGESILHQRRFISLIQPENIASRKVAEKTGMEVEKEIDLGGRKVLIYSSLIEGED